MPGAASPGRLVGGGPDARLEGPLGSAGGDVKAEAASALPAVVLPALTLPAVELSEAMLLVAAVAEVALPAVVLSAALVMVLAVACALLEVGAEVGPVAPGSSK